MSLVSVWPKETAAFWAGGLVAREAQQSQVDKGCDGYSKSEFSFWVVETPEMPKQKWLAKLLFGCMHVPHAHDFTLSTATAQAPTLRDGRDDMGAVLFDSVYNPISMSASHAAFLLCFLAPWGLQASTVCFCMVFEL